MSIQNPHSHFRLGVAFSFFLLILLSVFLYANGKIDSFVMIHFNHNKALDHIFQYVTVLGDGLIYVPIVLYCLLFNRQFLVPVVAAIIICTILTHFLKRIVFPDELRPISLEARGIVIRRIEGVVNHRRNSFPSGHTSTAFTMALLLASVMKQKIWAIVLPIIAFFVGYSRMYLAQHFAADVLAGMVVGIISAYLSLLIYDAWRKKYGIHARSLK